MTPTIDTIIAEMRAPNCAQFDRLMRDLHRHALKDDFALVWNEAIALALAALPVAPEGFVLVPREPTTAMLSAAAKHDYYSERDPTWRSLWKDMVEAAAPLAAAQGEDTK